MNLEKFATKVEKMTDVEALETMAVLLKDRVKVGTVLLKDDMELIVGTKTLLISGELVIEGEPALFAWPLQPLPIPDAFKKDHPEKFN